MINSFCCSIIFNRWKLLPSIFIMIAYFRKHWWQQFDRHDTGVEKWLKNKKTFLVFNSRLGINNSKMVQWLNTKTNSDQFGQSEWQFPILAFVIIWYDMGDHSWILCFFRTTPVDIFKFEPQDSISRWFQSINRFSGGGADGDDITSTTSINFNYQMVMIVDRIESRHTPKIWQFWFRISTAITRQTHTQITTNHWIYETNVFSHYDQRNQKN